MLETTVRRAWIHLLGQAKLPDMTQALQLTTVQPRYLRGGEADVAVNSITNRLWVVHVYLRSPSLTTLPSMTVPMQWVVYSKGSPS